jgi:hypothetical protein
MTGCEWSVGLLIAVCIAASLHATYRVDRHLLALLPWLTLSIATSDPLALAAASLHGVAAYLLFVRTQGAMVREAFALADGAHAPVRRVVSWASPLGLRALHPPRPLPR